MTILPSMPLRTMTTDEPPLQLREETAFSLVRCETHALATTYVPVFVGLLDDWQVVFAKFLTAQDRIARAEAKRDASDVLLDRLVDDVAAAILAANGNNRDSDEFRVYFRSKPPHEVKQPILGDELEWVRGWIAPLLAKPAYANLGARAETLCKMADDAVAEVANATQAYRVFRLTGDYKEFVDKLNLARKDVYGALGKLPHSDPGQGLPSDFANDFFKHETRRNKKVTIEMLRGRIENLKEELETQMTVLAAMEAKAQANAAAQAAQKALEEELEQAKQAQAELAKKTAALEAKLKK